MKNNIALLVDSGSMTEERDNIYIVNLSVIIDGKDFEGDTVDLLRKMEDGAVPTTSQPNLFVLEEKINELLNTYSDVIYLPLSKGISGAYNTGLSLCNDHVYVIDTRATCYSIELMCNSINENLNQGKSIKEIKDLIESTEIFTATLIPGDLKYLKRGGRISPTAAMMANLLGIKPILKLEDGKIDSFGKTRSEKHAMTLALEAIKVEDIENYDWFIIDAENKQCDKWIKLFNDVIGAKPIYTKATSVIAAHLGPGTIAFARQKKF